MMQEPNITDYYIVAGSMLLAALAALFGMYAGEKKADEEHRTETERRYEQGSENKNRDKGMGRGQC